MSKEWKELKGVMISNSGEVKEGDKLLETTTDKKGYLKVYIDNLGIELHIHRLVALAFCTPRKGCNVVNHKDFNKLNNCASNLEWVSNLENRRHYFETLNHTDGQPLTWKSVREIRYLHRVKSLSLKEISSLYKLNILLVNNIVSYQIWRDLIPKGLGYYDREIDRQEVIERKAHKKAEKKTNKEANRKKESKELKSKRERKKESKVGDNREPWEIEREERWKNRDRASSEEERRRNKWLDLSQKKREKHDLENNT